MISSCLVIMKLSILAPAISRGLRSNGQQPPPLSVVHVTKKPLSAEAAAAQVEVAAAAVQKVGGSFLFDTISVGG